MADMSHHVLTHGGLQIWLFFEPWFTESKTCQDRSLFLSACFASFAFFCHFNWKQMHLFALFGMPRVSDTFACFLQPFLGRDLGRVHFGRYKRIGVTGFEPWSKVPGPCHQCWAGLEWPHAHVTWICVFLFRFPGLGPRVFKETVLSPGVTVSVTIAWFFCPVGKSRSLSRDQV